MVHSLLDGPSLAGAFRFAIRRTAGTVMEVENRLFVRRDVERLGIAPLTSMFWFAEYGRERQADWRPEVHDADGLAIWTGAGERIWRPLNNPTRIVVTSYLDDNPRGFGLGQRDRDFDHYLDGVGYEKRPTAWVEPLGGWGKGMVQLVEIPTDDEINDNICAFWLPEKPAQAPATRSASATGCTGWPPSPASRPTGWPRWWPPGRAAAASRGKPRPRGVDQVLRRVPGRRAPGAAARRRRGPSR